MFPPATKTSPPIKTLIYSSTRSYRGTYSTATPLALLLIANTLGTTASAFAAFASMEYIKIYSAITVSVRVNIVYK